MLIDDVMSVNDPHLVMDPKLILKNGPQIWTSYKIDLCFVHTKEVTWPSLLLS